jgi:TP901 family phage tail tape measure protein
MAGFNLKAVVTCVDKLSPQLNKMKGKLEKFQEKMNKSEFGKFGLKEAVTGLKISAPFVQGVKEAIEYEEKMVDIKKAVNFDTPEQFKQMGQDIREMSLRLPMAAKDIASIVVEAGKANIPKADLIKFAENAVKMGIAFDSSSEEACNTMAIWRTSLKLTQNEVINLSDKISLLSTTQNLKIKDISDVVTRMGEFAETSGVSVDKLAALSSTLIASGSNAEQASTGIKNFMLTLTSGEAATEQQQKALQQLGLTSTEIAKGMQNDAEGTIMSVLESLGKISKDSQPTTLTALFGEESVVAISPLLNNMDLLKENFKRVGDSSQYAGSMQKKYELRSNTTASKLQLFNNALTNISIVIGDALLPVFTELLDELNPLIVSFGHFIQEHPELVKMAAMAIAGLIGLRVACAGVNIIVGVLSTGITIFNGVLKSATIATKLFTFAQIALSKACKVVRGASIALNAVMAMNPIGLIMTGIAIAATLIIAYWNDIVKFFQWLWGVIKPYVMPIFDAFIMPFKMAASFIVSAWDSVGTFFGGLWEFIKPYVMPIIDVFVTPFKVAGDAIPEAWGGIKNFFKGLWGSIKPYVMPIIDVFVTPFKAAGDAISKAWGGIKNFFKGLWESIKPYVMPIIDVFVTPFKAAGDAIPKAWEGVKDFFKGLWGCIWGDDEEVEVTLKKIKFDTSSLRKETNSPSFRVPQMPRNNFSNNNINRNSNGELVVKFENAPQGTVVKQTKQALWFNTKADVGWNPYAVGVN